jgi:hypothetical protein
VSLCNWHAIILFVTATVDICHQDGPTVGHSRSGYLDIPAVNNGMNTRKVFSDPLFLWSSDVRCKKLIPQYLSLVHAGIVTAASDLRLPLNQRDVAWLSLHENRFPMYIPTSSEP